MTMPGVSRPLRIAGLALLGVAVIAIGFGTVSAVTGGGEEEVAAPSTQQPTTTPAPTSSAAPTPSATTSASASASASATTTTSAPSATGTTGGPSQGGEGATQRPVAAADGKDADEIKTMVDVRVYNNSTISNLATRAARDLRARGWGVSEVGNYADGVISTTTVFYRPGTEEEAAAQEIGAKFGMRVEPRFEGIKDASPGVIVIVTKDYEGRDRSAK